VQASLPADLPAWAGKDAGPGRPQKPQANPRRAQQQRILLPVYKITIDLAPPT